MSDIVARLQGAMHGESAQHSPGTTAAIEAMRDAIVEVKRLTNEVMEQARLNGMGGERELALRAEIARLQQENADLRRWKALDKPITAAMNVVNNDVQSLRAEIERLQAALQRIADMCPATCELTLAHEMADNAYAALKDTKP